MLKLRRRRREEHDEWLNSVPELLIIPAAVAFVPPGYSVYLVAHHHWTAGVALMLAWGCLFTWAAWWLHGHKYCHIAASTIGGIAAVAISAMWFAG